MDTTMQRLCRQMEEASAELEAATRDLVEADPDPFIQAMQAVERHQQAHPEFLRLARAH